MTDKSCADHGVKRRVVLIKYCQDGDDDKNGEDEGDDDEDGEDEDGEDQYLSAGFWKRRDVHLPRSGNLLGIIAYYSYYSALLALVLVLLHTIQYYWNWY